MTQKRKQTLKKVISDFYESEESKAPKTYLPAGSIIDQRYEIIREIGSGSFGVVYLVLDQKQNIHKALKIFGKYDEVRDLYDYIRNEASLQMKLNHPNILRVFNFHDTEFVFIEMEYIDGESLDQLIQNNKVNNAQKLQICKQIASALKDAHDQFIAHLDVKPANIIVNTLNEAKLCDFGLAKIKEKNQEKKGLADDYITKEYLAPEFLNNEGSEVQRDIFAYGVSIYELIYKQLPFKTNEDGSIDYQIPKHLLKNKKPIDQIIKKCLFYFAEDRYQDFGAIVNDLQEIKEQKRFPFNEIPKRIFSKIPKIKVNPNIKNDLRYLWISLLSLLCILPFFAIINHRYDPVEKEIEIDAPPFSVFVNMQYAGEPPFKSKLKAGDQLQFVDDQGEAILDYTYNGEKRLKLNIKGNKIFINNKLRGMYIDRVDDLPLKANLQYIKSKIRLSKHDFKRQKHPRLNLHLSPLAEESDLDQLPNRLRFLNLKNNKRIKHLSYLKHLKHLKGLDLENSSVNPDSLHLLKNLEHLNLKRTRINKIKPLIRNRNIRHLNISETAIKDTKGLNQMDKIETLSVSTDSLSSMIEISKLPNLQSLSNQSNLDLSQKDQYAIEKLLESNRTLKLRKERYTYKKKDYSYILMFMLVSLIMAVILFLLFRILFKRLPQIQKEVEQRDEAISQSEPKNKKITYSKREIEHISMAIQDKRFYYPPKENAMYYLHLLLKENPEDQTLKDMKKTVIEQIEQKIHTHLERKEYEPVFLAAQACNEYCDEGHFSQYYKKMSKKLIKNHKIKMIKMKNCSFEMGDFTGAGNGVPAPLHQVSLDDFQISQTVITNRQFCEFLNSEGNQSERGARWYKEDSQYSRIEKILGKYQVKKPYEDFPVYEVSWYGAQRFCEWMGGRLPSEAEWEYSARSKGKNNIYACGNQVDKNIANYLIDMNDALWHSMFPVKSYPPNKANLYEMSGNILEWCFDGFDREYYSISPQQNPMGIEDSESKVVRGGAWCFGTEQMKTFYRGSAKPLTRNNFIGFRLVIPNNQKLRRIK